MRIDELRDKLWQTSEATKRNTAITRKTLDNIIREYMVHFITDVFFIKEKLPCITSDGYTEIQTLRFVCNDDWFDIYVSGDNGIEYLIEKTTLDLISIGQILYKVLVEKRDELIKVKL